MHVVLVRLVSFASQGQHLFAWIGLALVGLSLGEFKLYETCDSLTFEIP